MMSEKTPSKIDDRTDTACAFLLNSLKSGDTALLFLLMCSPFYLFIEYMFHFKLADRKWKLCAAVILPVVFVGACTYHVPVWFGSRLINTIFFTAMTIIFIGFTSNSAVLLYIRTITVSKELVLVESMAKYFDKNMEHVFGHKLWADKDTYKLFDSLMRATDIGRSKWLIVNFMNTIVKNSHTGNGKIESTMTLTDYSEFLAANMDHADNIYWFLPLQDFVSILLPQFVLHSIALLGWNKSPYEIDFKSNRGEGLMLRHFITNNDALRTKIDKKMKVERNNGSLEDQVKILNLLCQYQVGFGENVISKESIKSTMKNEDHKIFFIKNFPWPHVAAYKQSGNSYRILVSKSIESDTYAIDVDKLELEIKTDVEITRKGKLRTVSVAKAFHEKISNKCDTYTECDCKKELLEFAFDLFDFTNLPKERIKIAPDNDGQYVDMGLYNKKILVRSKACEGDDDKRVVSWEYNEDGNEKLLETIDTAMKTNAGHYNAFKKELISAIIKTS